MMKKVLVAALASAFATTGWTADDGRTKHEAMGLGSGAAIGAAAGGPVGLILGAALGGWLGDRFDHERSGRLGAEAESADRRAEVDRLEARLGVSEREAARLEAALLAAERSHHDTLQEALDIQVYFRTADSTLNGTAEQRLTRIAELIAPMEGVVVLLEGHADPRGDEAYNEELSAQRAEAVRQAFMRAGVAEGRIAVTAEGESRSRADENDVDALALDRRVEISIVGRDGSPPRVARRGEP
jgi:outer membrane protein OmpA-like peptidoglycan-associated protein